MTAKNFKDQDLRGQDFSNQDLRSSNFMGANISFCDFTNANLRGCNMVNTIITGAIFDNSDMFYCNFKNAMGEASWDNTRVFGALKSPEMKIKMIGANLSRPGLQKRYIAPVIWEVFMQTPGFDPFKYDDLEDADKLTLTRWRAGYSVPLLTGTYPVVSDERNLYSSIEKEYGSGIPMNIILDEIMKQGTIYNTDTNQFNKKEI